MDLPSLENWKDTRIGLHHAAQVIGGVRRAAATPEPNWTHLGLTTTPQGLTTGTLPGVGTLTLLFEDKSIILDREDGTSTQLGLDGHTQLSLADALDDLLDGVKADRSKLKSSEPIKVDAAFAADYARVLNTSSEILGDFRKSLSGERSRLVVWPHGFDASFLWFATDKADEEAPHMAFGFSPGSEGFDQPYFYAYAHPQPDGLMNTPLPHRARWYQGNWKGMALDYDRLIGKADFKGLVEKTFRTVYEAVVPHLKQSA